MSDHPIEQKLKALGLILPQPTRAAGNYLPALVHQRHVYISGQFPFHNGTLQYRGPIGKLLNVEQGYQAAQLAALNVLAHLREHTKQWRLLDQLLTVQAFINSAEGWYEQHLVLNGASDLFHAVLGTQAGHTRSVAGVSQLPFDATVELVVTAALI